MCVGGFTDQAAGDLASEFLFSGKESKIGSTVRQGNTQRLTFADHNISTHFAGCFEKTESDWIGYNRQQSAFFVNLLSYGGEIKDSAKEIRILNHDKSSFIFNLSGEIIRVAGDGEITAESLNIDVLVSTQVRAKHFAVLGVDRGRKDDAGSLASKVVISHDPGFSGGRCTVIMRGVADLHAGEVGDEGLKFKDRLQSTLGDFRLVRGVGGVEFGAAQDGIYTGGDVMVVRASTQKTQ